ncbi:MAG: O-methyltransferase [Butyrivibrio sp.]|nr:O-methyltransferase [Butyrivibrio sp.]
MISEERIRTFINSLDQGNDEFLDELEKEALADDVPIIRKDTQSLIRFLLTLERPLNILEVGCAVGFSALLMARYSEDNAKITTIEKFEKRIPIAKRNFEKYDEKKKITLLEGDAAEILAELDGQYDFIFMDAAKGQYLNFLPDCKRLLRKGGLLLSDNVLQDGDVMESRFAVTRRNRTIHERMRDYLFAIKHDPELESVILTVGDGMAISVKK